MPFDHEVTARVKLYPDGDARALGGAITTALCGHWDHEGACRWPNSTTTEYGGETLVVRTLFDAPSADVREVGNRIRAALAAGKLMGPDGHITRWELVSAP
jgi:hypothetical protein